MKTINLLFMFFFFTGCMTVNRIQKHCEQFAAICITESSTKVVYRDTTIYKDRIIHVPLPVKDTVRIIDTIRIINNIASMPTRYQQFGIIGVNAGVNNSVLRVNAYLTDSTLLYPLHDTILLTNAVKEQNTAQTVVVKVIPPFYKKLLAVNIFIVVALAGFGYMKIKQNGFKWLFSAVKNKILPPG